MAAYPRTQSEISTLAGSMIAGYSKHPDDFPSTDVAVLQAARDEYQAATEALVAAKSAAKQAAKLKADKLKQLQIVTKAQLKRSEVDTADNPVKLGEIGWGPKAKSRPMRPPSQPTNLTIIAQGIGGTENNRKGILHLRWKKSDYTKTRTVRYYCVERRQLAMKKGDRQEQWLEIGSAINNRICLKNEPLGMRLEYRVRAVNKGGQSMPTNSITVVL